MDHTTVAPIRREIRCKKEHDLASYFNIVHLTKAYYDAMRHNKPLPEKPLPELQYLLDANTIVKAYVKGRRTSSIKLYMALLKVEDVVAVWLFYNEPSLNMRLGDYQLLAVKHS
jgi:hypothetical protein